MRKDCIFRNEKFLLFVGGALTALIGAKTLKSSCARNVWVKGLAKGMKIQNNVKTTFQNMKEDAQDICHDATAEAFKDSDEA